MTQLNHNSLERLQGGNVIPNVSWVCDIGGTTVVLALSDPALNGLLNATGNTVHVTCIPTTF